MYKSRYLSSNNGYIIANNSISDNEYKTIKTCYETIQKMLLLSDYYLMTCENFIEFINDCKRNGVWVKNNFINCNRLFINTINMFYVWRVFIENTKINSEYEQIVKQYSKIDILYLTDRMRHKSVHGEMPIKTIRTEFDGKNTNNRFIVDLKRLMNEKEFNSLKSSVRDKIINNSEIDAVDFSKKFLFEFKTFNYKILNSIKPDYNRCIECLMNYFPKNEKHVFNLEIIGEDLEDTINIGLLYEIVNQKIELMCLMNTLIDSNLSKERKNNVKE